MQLKARAARFARQSCKINPMQALDKLDWQILRSLQGDGRATCDPLTAELVK